MVFRVDDILVHLHNHSDGLKEIKDNSKHSFNILHKGSKAVPYTTTLAGRQAIVFAGGQHGSSYLQLPSEMMSFINDDTGLTLSCWIYLETERSVWERIIDFGAGPEGPYLFLTRNLRAVCFNGMDIAADFNQQLPLATWTHIALVLTGTQGGTTSQAGPKLYVNGELVVNGEISQTTSGTYLAYRQWMSTLSDTLFVNNYIGHSQFTADADLSGAISDFKLFNHALQDEDVISLMCDSLDATQLIALASQYDLSFPSHIISSSLYLRPSLLNGLVDIEWKSSHPHIISHEGQFNREFKGSAGITLTATLTRGDASYSTSFALTALAENIHPYEIKLDKEGSSLAISQDLYGLFFEDINNAADGGIYAELVRNRSFEAFIYESFSHVCGEHGHSSGKLKNPLEGWYGDTDKVEVKSSGGLNEYFNLGDAHINATFIHLHDGATIINKGFNDTNHQCAMNFIQGEKYLFTVWAKANAHAELELILLDGNMQPISTRVKVTLINDGQWHKYGIPNSISLKAEVTTLGQLALTAKGELALDMISLFPENVWGKEEENESSTAHINYKCNSNYRLRKDMVLALQQMKPKFLRFPGGCISEGSHVWENVYDWKHSVGDVELRKENFNVWGYMMTLGLGYLEYFQLAEDLNATPLPVMACGVLCQARSDYANPAGGALRDYYIKNFTDLIDFSLSTDFEGNEWAKLRKKMGHEAPFDLRYLGVGNENWGTEFFANFEYFKVAIDEYMVHHYPHHQLTIISTVGAQADDQAYQQGWKFLNGKYEGSEMIAFTDGKERIEENVTWYKHQANYMDTIVDEHYYRSNDYLLRNADRYNYYYRAYDEQGNLDEKLTSKVFVGEYASNDKNTLAGAIAEAAIMTGFENNADVVRLAAYAPLLNKVLTDGQYRWTPDCIWFDDTDIWFTPNYYVQQMFAEYLGKQTIATQFNTYKNGKAIRLRAEGGICLSTLYGDVCLKGVIVKDTITHDIIFEQDFTAPLSRNWKNINAEKPYLWRQNEGVILSGDGTARVGLYLEETWSQIEIEVLAVHLSDADGLYIGVGTDNIKAKNFSMIEYVAGEVGQQTGVKVHKNGIQSYTLGDFATSTMAGNLRAAFAECLIVNESYLYQVQYGGKTGNSLEVRHKLYDQAHYLFDAEYKLEPYNDEIYYTVSQDEHHIYIKMVNAATCKKKLKIDFASYNVESPYKLKVLSGHEALLHIPNVNTKQAEQIVPYNVVGEMNNTKAELTLPALSVVVGVWKLC